MDSKFCKKCGVAKPTSAFQRSSRSGLQSACRECRAAAAVEYRERTRERRLAYNRDYYQEHKKERAAYYQSRRDELIVAMRERYAKEDPAVRRARWEAWYADPQNAESVRQRAKEWAETHPDRRAAYAEAYYQENKEHYYAHARVRRARKRDAAVEYVDSLVVLERGDGVCGICGNDVDPMEFHVDHVIPLSRGGEHSYANTQPAHPVCNLRKSTRLPSEMAA